MASSPDALGRVIALVRETGARGFAAAGTSALQLAERREIAASHSRQNLARSGFAWPQVGQFITRSRDRKAFDDDLRHLLVVWIGREDPEAVLHCTCSDPNIVGRNRRAGSA